MSLQRIQICLPDRQMKLVKDLADEKELSFAEILRRIIDDYFDGKKKE